MKVVVFWLGIVFSNVGLAASDEVILGKLEHYPICRELIPLAERCLVGTLSHYDEVIPAHIVAKAAVPSVLSPVAQEPAITYTYQGQPSSIDAFLSRSRNTGLLVMHGDTILVESYQYDRKAEDRFQSYSMAKTVVGMLIGIAIAEKKIASIDDLAGKYVPALKGKPYGDTSLRHLLTMSSGVRFNEQGRDVSALVGMTLFQIGQGGAGSVSTFTRRDAPAGTRFSYSSAESEVLGLVLLAVTGKPLAEYLSEKIWQPMGAEADATWLIDAGGQELGYMGLNATLRDWGRFGMLLANDGMLYGKQIIPAEWVREATTAQVAIPQHGAPGYGYQTWIIHRTERIFALIGTHGQAIAVDPKTKVVVVHTAVHRQSIYDPQDPLVQEQFSLFYGVVNSFKQRQ